MPFILKLSLAVLIISIIVSFLAGVVTRNYSHVDRLWSLLPPVYACIWMTEYYNNPRFVICAFLIILWGIRLTWNFHRRGGYSFSLKEGFTGEDYRWEIMRQKIKNRFLFETFNLFFISGFQLILIFLFTLPLYYAGKASTKLNSIDFLLFSSFVILLILETIADNQQYEYHSRKNSPHFSGGPEYSAGFNMFGLWKYSRHPNYACELGQWITLWLLAVNATGSIHPSGVGAVILILLFIGSTRLTESITESKYPLYRDWKKATSPWVPFIDMFFRKKARKRFWKKLEAEKQ